jgi:hypothetical protein
LTRCGHDGADQGKGKTCAARDQPRCRAYSINDRVAGAEVTNDHDLRTGAGRSCTSRRVRSPFALVESTESAGGFAIPITIDPSIIYSGSGALDPFVMLLG